MNHAINYTIFSFYSSRGSCWFWNKYLISLHAIPDLITFLCYMLIPLIIYHIYYKGKLSSLASFYPKLWWSGGCFIFFCGLTRLGAFGEIWLGGAFYYFTGFNKLLMALSSVIFVVMFWKERLNILRLVRIVGMIHTYNAENENSIQLNKVKITAEETE